MPVAEFLDGWPLRQDLLLDRWLEQLVADKDLSQGWPVSIEIIVLPVRDWPARKALELPIQALAVGDESGPFFRMIRGREWYAGDPAVERFGLVLHELGPVEPPAFSVFLRENRTDILFCGRRELHELALPMHELPFEKRPRLLVTIDKDADPVFWGIPDIPAGVSLLWLPVMPDEDAGWLVKDVLYGMIHDLPSHEILYGLRTSERYRWRDRPRLVADPLGLHDLRISSAVAPLAVELDRFDQENFTGDVEQFLNRVERDASPGLVAQLRELAEAARPMHAMFHTVDQMKLHRPDFTRESRGLASLSHVLAAKKEAYRMRGRVREMLQDLAKDPAARQLLRRNSIVRWTSACDASMRFLAPARSSIRSNRCA